MRLSGTSVATGLASGVVALALSANPGLTPNAVKMALQFTAIPAIDPATGRRYDALTQGTGGLNGQGVPDLVATVDTSRGDGQGWLRAGVTPQSLIAGEPVDWAGSVIWSGRRVRGEGLIAQHHTAWHRNIVWGTNIVLGTALLDVDLGFDIVWGTSEEWDNIVWGTGLEADNIVWGTLYDVNIVWGTAVTWDTTNVVGARPGAAGQNRR